MFNKAIYKQYLEHGRHYYNGQEWFYDVEDAERWMDDLDAYDCIIEDLKEFRFSVINIKL